MKGNIRTMALHAHRSQTPAQVELARLRETAL